SQQRLDILSLVDANHDDAAVIPDLMETAGGSRTKRPGDRYRRRVEVVGGDGDALGDEVLDQAAPHPAEADKADAFECRHLFPSVVARRCCLIASRLPLAHA